MRFCGQTTQSSIPPGSVNEEQFSLRRQRQVWFILLVDKRVGVRVKLWDLSTTRAIPERYCSWIALHYETAPHQLSAYPYREPHQGHELQVCTIYATLSIDNYSNGILNTFSQTAQLYLPSECPHAVTLRRRRPTAFAHVHFAVVLIRLLLKLRERVNQRRTTYIGTLLYKKFRTSLRISIENSNRFVDIIYQQHIAPIIRGI